METRTRPFAGKEFLDLRRAGRGRHDASGLRQSRIEPMKLLWDCMAEYDLDGWSVPDLITWEDVDLFLKKSP